MRVYLEIAGLVILGVAGFLAYATLVLAVLTAPFLAIGIAAVWIIKAIFGN